MSEEQKTEQARNPVEPMPWLTSRVLLLVFILLAAGILAAGCLFLWKSEKNSRAQAEQQLSSVADLKVNDLSRWRKERLGDGGVLFKNASISGLAERFLKKPGDKAAGRQLQMWFGKYVQAYQYDQVSLLDGKGFTRMTVPAGSVPISPVVSKRTGRNP